MPETIFWWLFTLACVFGFFSSYGIVEDLICKWVRCRRSRVVTKSTATTSPLQGRDRRGNGCSEGLLY